MGASESNFVSLKGEQTTEDNLEVLNTSSMDLIEKTADFLKAMESDNYGRFKLMQYRVSKRQFAVIERVTSEYKDFESYCREIDKRLRFDVPSLVRWVRAYKSCEKEYCSSFFKAFISVDYIPHTLQDQLESRRKRQTHCGEKEIFNMIDSILSALIFLKSQGISHKYIQPKTILYDQTNRTYQITDIQFFNGGLSEYQQFLFGYSSTTCYLSPQLLKALSHRQQIPEHSSTKSDIFSLGLCALEMATMKSIQGIYDFHDFSIFQDQLNQLIQEVQTIYSDHLSQLLISMLKVQEIQRPDFDDLAYMLRELSLKPQFIDSMQSLRASVISEELVKSGGLSKKSGLMERLDSSNLLRSKCNISINKEQNDKIKSHNINNNTKPQNQLKSTQSILKKNWRKEGELGEVEEEITPKNTQGGDSKDQQPFIRVLDPIYTLEQDEIHSPIAIPSNQQLGEISSLNLVSQRNTKQLSMYNQEDLELQQIQISNNNTTKRQKTQTQSNVSPNKDQNTKNKKFNNGSSEKIKQNNQQKQPNRVTRSQSQISNVSKKPFVDPIDKEYEEFKAKQRQILMQQKHKIIQDDNTLYQQEKQSWEQQQQWHIQDSKRHDQLQQSYIQSQQNYSHHYLDEINKYVNSKNSLPSGSRHYTPVLQNNNQQSSLNPYIPYSPARSTFSTVKSPNEAINSGVLNQNTSTPSSNHYENYNVRLPPSSSRNSYMRSQHQLNKSPKINVNGKQQFYNDENEQNYENKQTQRSYVMNNNDNTMYQEYNTNNLNNSRFDHSYVGSKVDMSMLSNYEIKDIHIQPMRRNDNIQNTLNMLEQRIDKIDQSLVNIKKPLRSSSNQEFAFHQNSKPLSSNSTKPITFQQQLKQQQQQQQQYINRGSSAKNINIQNHLYESNIPYSTPFQQGYNFDNQHQSRF